MIKNEICVLDLISSRQLINVCHRPVESFDIEVTEDGTIMGSPTLDKIYEGFFGPSTETNGTSMDNGTINMDDQINNSTSIPTSAAEKEETTEKSPSLPLDDNVDEETHNGSEKSTSPQFVYIDSEETDPLKLDWINKKAPFVLHRKKRSIPETKKDVKPFCGCELVVFQSYFITNRHHIL